MKPVNAGLNNTVIGLAELQRATLAGEVKPQESQKIARDLVADAHRAIASDPIPRPANKLSKPEKTRSSARTRGSGGLYKRGAVYWIKYRRQGKVFFESSKSESQSVATSLLKRRLAEIQMNEFIQPEDRRLTLKELYDGLIADYRRTGKDTLAWVEARWKSRLAPFFRDIKAVNVSTDLLNRYVDKQQADGLGNATINRDLAALKRAYSLAHNCTPRKIRDVPVFPANLPEPPPRRGFVDESGYDRLCQNAGELWLRTFLAVGYAFGLRKEEILGLRVEQVDLAARTIRLNRGETKNDEARVIRMTDEVYTLIAQCVLGKLPTDRVFTRPKGKAIKSFRGRWEKLVTAAGVPELNVHDLRRSAIRNMVRRGITEVVAMAISGHKTRSVFDRYNIVSEHDLATAARKIEAGREEEQQAAKEVERLQLGDNRTTYSA